MHVHRLGGRVGYANMLIEWWVPNQKPTYWGPHAENHAVSFLIK